MEERLSAVASFARSRSNPHPHKVNESVVNSGSVGQPESTSRTKLVEEEELLLLWWHSG